MATKKSNGEGTINKYKNGWRASLTIGRNDKGKLIRKQFYGKTKSEVIKKMDEYKAKDMFNLIPDDGAITIEEWIEKWLNIYKINEIKPSTYEKYNGLLKNYIKDTIIGKIKLKDLKGMHLQKFYNDLIGKDRKTPSLVKSLNKMIGSALSHAQKENYAIINAAKAVIIPKVIQKSKIDFFTVEEQKDFLNIMKNNRLESFYISAFGTGMRLGELLALRWADIDFDGCTINVNKSLRRIQDLNQDNGKRTKLIEQSPKTESSNRIIPLPMLVVKSLKVHKEKQAIEKNLVGDLYENNEFVFCTEFGKPLDARNVRRAYERALSRANIKYRKFHSIRHTYATRLFENSVPIKTVQSLLGHRNFNTTLDIYTHVTENEKLKGVEALDACF